MLPNCVNVLLGITIGASYIVQPGDTLEGIARQQLGDVNRWPEIFVLNHGIVQDPDQIAPDQILTLPDDTPMQPPPRIYTVRGGDTLSAIASSHLGDADRWPEIFELNRAVLSEPDQIFPGQLLVLPA